MDTVTVEAPRYVLWLIGAVLVLDSINLLLRAVNWFLKWRLERKREKIRGWS